MLFADVVGSMDLAAAVGVERLREIMGYIFDPRTRVVKRYGGNDEFTGDGIMALFGVPKALEDHAFRACLAALQIQCEFGDLGMQPQPRLRIGLNSGEAIAGQIGSSATGYTAVGEEVGMAQRMESVAPPGGVMLSESTARLVNSRASMSEPEMVHVRDAHTVPARSPPSTEQNTARLQHDPELVGRAWELNAVAAMIADVSSGGGCVIEVVGSPAIGKSRLVQEAGAFAESHHIKVFTAHCELHMTEIPFRAVTGLLRSVFRVDGLDDAAARKAIGATLAGADDTDIALLHDLLGIREPGAGPVEGGHRTRGGDAGQLLNTAALARAEPAVIVGRRRPLDRPAERSHAGRFRLGAAADPDHHARHLPPRVPGVALAVVTTYRFVFGIPAGALAADAAALEETSRVLRTAERFGEDFTLASARLSHGIALIYREDALREEGFEYMALARDAACAIAFCCPLFQRPTCSRRERRLRAGDVDGAIDLARSTAAEVFASGNAIITPQATTVLVEALLCRSADGDLAAAGAAIDRLAATTSGYTFEELPLLRQRALLARAHGDKSAYLGFRDRYRTMANELGFERHISLGEALD